MHAGADRPRGGGGRKHSGRAGKERRQRGPVGGGPGPPAAFPPARGRILLRRGAQPPQRLAGLPGTAAAERRGLAV